MVITKEKKKTTGVIRDYAIADIKLEEGDATTPRREMVVTLLREGPGNAYHKNYYTRRALESALGQVKARPKQYFNHAKDVDNPDRDIRDWASSVLEAWIEQDGGKAKLKARVKVLDNWLWERAKIAPDQLAVSIEGRGAGQPETIEGSTYNAIHEITHLNGVNWVDYPGNAGMGVEVLEADKKKQEATNMLKEILESLKGLSTEELAEVAKARPELKEFFILPADDSNTKDQMKDLAESVKAIKAAADKQAADLTEKLDAMKKENSVLLNKLDAHEVKAQEAAKERMIEDALKGSRLKPEHVTETFKRTLNAVKEFKQGDKVVTEADQVKQLIEDREKICIADVAAANPAGGSSTGKEIEEKEKYRQFTMSIFGIDPNSFAEKTKEEENKAAAVAGK